MCLSCGIAAENSQKKNWRGSHHNNNNNNNNNNKKKKKKKKKNSIFFLELSLVEAEPVKTLE